MNFEKLKQEMDAQNMDSNEIPTNIKSLETSKMPIQKVRQTMRKEIITQLVIIALFFSIPSFKEMHQLPKAIYYILMFVTSLITVGYLLKMSSFLHKSSSLGGHSKDAVLSFINDLKLTLEVYKTAIISGSLLLPLSMVTFYFGRVKMDEELFENLILLNISSPTLLLYILGYLIIAILIYIFTIKWSNRLYGIHITNLENTLKEFESN
ncbi:MAG: hypothetical protein HRT58_09730 [Crocinitomicaceae bacterium]|nr:hypothetical protein [Flavobacteriales bacterium]NQZ35935.1 hypothetical protein [Crocinitomicaceae bacterium]